MSPFPCEYDSNILLRFAGICDTFTSHIAEEVHFNADNTRRFSKFYRSCVHSVLGTFNWIAITSYIYGDDGKLDTYILNFENEDEVAQLFYGYLELTVK